MPLTLADILTHFALVANENVCCSTCRETKRICKNGYYFRFRFDGPGQEKIPRYLCKNPACPRVSFSILPHPFLPWWRVSLCFLTTLWTLWRSGRCPTASLARQTGTSWTTMRRWLERAAWLDRWLAREENEALVAVRPCLDPQRSWTPFTQALSHAGRPG